MIIFLHGEDPFLVSRRKRLLQESFHQKNPQAEIATFDFEDDRSPEFVRRALSACEGGLFSEKKMILFLHIFMLEERGEKALLDFLKSEHLQRNNENIFLFVEPGKIKKTHPATKALLKVADKTEAIEAYTVIKGTKKVPDRRKLEEFATQELTAVDPGAKFEPEALRRLVEVTEGNTARLVSEVAKLAAYKPGAQIGLADVTLLIAAPQDEDIFRALDAIVSGRKADALRVFRNTGKTGEVYGALGMCAWQVRRLLIIREAYDNGKRGAGDIARSTKLAPFVVEKALPKIQNFSLQRLKAGLALLSDLDLEMKRGDTTPELALDLFVWKF